MIANALLKVVFSRLLYEGMKATNDLWNNNIKFYYETTQMGGIRMVLYKVEKDPESYNPFTVIGYIALTNDMDKCGTWRVSNVASAERGYGPLLYDLGMSAAYPDFIRADDRLRDGAKQIWNNILTTYRSKYEINPLDFTEYSEFECETGLKDQVMARIIDPIDLDSLPSTKLEEWEKKELISQGMSFFRKRYAQSKPKEPDET